MGMLGSENHRYASFATVVGAVSRDRVVRDRRGN